MHNTVQQKSGMSLGITFARDKMHEHCSRKERYEFGYNVCQTKCVNTLATVAAKSCAVVLHYTAWYWKCISTVQQHWGRYICVCFATKRKWMHQHFSRCPAQSFCIIQFDMEKCINVHQRNMRSASTQYEKCINAIWKNASTQYGKMHQLLLNNRAGKPYAVPVILPT